MVFQYFSGSKLMYSIESEKLLFVFSFYFFFLFCAGIDLS